MTIVRRVIFNQFKNVFSFNKSIKKHSNIPNYVSYESTLVTNFVKKLSCLFEKDRNRLMKLFSDYDFTQLENIYHHNDYICKTEQEIKQLKTLIEEKNTEKEMFDMFQSEIAELGECLEQAKQDFPQLLYQQEKDAEQEVLMELHAGVGGQEAMLFTKEIFDMYEQHISFKGWHSKLLDCDYSDLGGIKYASMSVCGLNAYKRLRFEGGVHRVQRTPTTEKGGRLHTSAMSVAVILQPSEVEVQLKPQDLKVETCRASGKGGQHVNTTDSAVRIVHLPTGIAAECQKERSQTKNKEMALKVLRSRIYEILNDEAMKKYSANKKLQMGSGDRNEKIRTYNFRDDRVTDHRINTSLFGLSDFFEGSDKLDGLIDALENTRKTEMLVANMTRLVEGND